MTHIQIHIIARLIPEAERVAHVDDLFGVHFPLKLEPAIFNIAGSLSQQYRGGYWQFHALSNGGFFMAPESDRLFDVLCPNAYDGRLSSEAFGVTVCLYAFSQLSFGAGGFAEVCSDHFHLLRAFAIDHQQAIAILGACD